MSSPREQNKSLDQGLERPSPQKHVWPYEIFQALIRTTKFEILHLWPWCVSNTNVITISSVICEAASAKNYDFQEPSYLEFTASVSVSDRTKVLKPCLHYCARSGSLQREKFSSHRRKTLIAQVGSLQLSHPPPPTNNPPRIPQSYRHIRLSQCPTEMKFLINVAAYTLRDQIRNMRLKTS